MSTVENTTAKARFREDIQGLRGIAVLAVVMAHLGVPGVFGGFVGVDIFYVISGFLIVSLMHREAMNTGRISIRAFYGRRARRILPAAVTVLGVVVIAARLLMNPLRAAHVVSDATWSSFFALNVRLIHVGTDYFAQGSVTSPLQHFWSLAVEEQFYTVVPILFLLVLAGRRGKSSSSRLMGVIAALSVASFAWCVYSTTTAPTSAYFSSLTRAWQLGAGALLGLLVGTYPHGLRLRWAAWAGWAGLAGVALSLISIDGSHYPGTTALLPTLATVGLLASGSVTADGRVQRLLAFRPLTWLGRVSFSLYLWHWPVIVFADLLVPGIPQLTRIPLLLATSILLATLSFHGIERPFMHMSLRRPRSLAIRAIPRSARVGLVTAVTLALLVFIGPALNLSGPSSVSAHELMEGCTPARYRTPERLWSCKLSSSLRIEQVPRDLSPTLDKVLQDRETDGCLTVTTANLAQCRWGSTTARTTVLLIGDSHAEMWLTPLKTIFPARRYSLQELTMGRCPNSAITRVDLSIPGLAAGCNQHRRWVWNYIARTHPDIVVMSDSEGFSTWLGPRGEIQRTGTVRRWARGLRVSLARIRPYAGRVILIGQTPRSHKLIECLPHDLALAPCYGDQQMALQRSIERRSVTAVGGAFIDPAPWLCFRNVCPPVIDGSAAYWDESHLTRTMAGLLTPVLRDAVRRALASRPAQLTTLRTNRRIGRPRSLVTSPPSAKPWDSRNPSVVSLFG